MSKVWLRQSNCAGSVNRSRGTLTACPVKTRSRGDPSAMSLKPKRIPALSVDGDTVLLTRHTIRRQERQKRLKRGPGKRKHVGCMGHVSIYRVRAAIPQETKKRGTRKAAFSFSLQRLGLTLRRPLRRQRHRLHRPRLHPLRPRRHLRHPTRLPARTGPRYSRSQSHGQS